MLGATITKSCLWPLTPSSVLSVDSPATDDELNRYIERFDAQRQCEQIPKYLRDVESTGIPEDGYSNVVFNKEVERREEEKERIRRAFNGEKPYTMKPTPSSVLSEDSTLKKVPADGYSDEVFKQAYNQWQRKQEHENLRQASIEAKTELGLTMQSIGGMIRKSEESSEINKKWELEKSNLEKQLESDYIARKSQAMQQLEEQQDCEKLTLSLQELNEYLYLQTSQQMDFLNYREWINQEKKEKPLLTIQFIKSELGVEGRKDYINTDRWKLEKQNLERQLESDYEARKSQEMKQLQEKQECERSTMDLYSRNNFLVEKMKIKNKLELKVDYHAWIKQKEQNAIG